MATVISIHEYELKPGVLEDDFQQAIVMAENRGLFQLPGLVNHYMVKGIRGSRSNRYAAIWVYESRQAWERLWGSLENPLPKEEYPGKWKVWEDEFLAPLLSQAPDQINYTAYEEW
jgi:hypothetical protein